MESLNRCELCLGEFAKSELIQCLHCDKRFCRQCITPCKVVLKKTLTINGDEMEPLNKCDFCLQQFDDYQLIRCFQCDKIFCQKCTKPCQVLFLKTCGQRELVMHYCTPKCRWDSAIIPGYCWERLISQSAHRWICMLLWCKDGFFCGDRKTAFIKCQLWGCVLRARMCSPSQRYMVYPLHTTRLSSEHASLSSKWLTWSDT
jgi:hypothetical protein